MKILFISGFAPYPWDLASGIFITRRFKELQKASIEYMSLTPYFLYPKLLDFAKKFLGKKIIRLPDYLEYENLRFDYVPIKTNISKFFETRVMDPSKWVDLIFASIEKTIGDKKFDLVHAHRSFPHGAVANLIAEYRNIPSVITAHGSEIHNLRKKNKKLTISTIKALEEAEQTIFVSSGLLQHAIKLGFSGLNAKVIPNGIDPNLFKPMPKEKIRRELGIRNHHHCIGFVGNLIHVKRADSLPFIFNHVNNVVPNMKFIIVGEGSYRKKIERKCDEFDLDVLLTGKVSPEKVPYFMNAMDFMVLPSRNEGWPCVVLEAHACGVPVIGSSNGGIPEAVGEGGTIVQEGEKFDIRFAKAIIEEIKKPQKPQKPEMLISRAQDFTWSAIVNEEINTYCKVLENYQTH